MALHLAIPLLVGNPLDCTSNFLSFPQTPQHKSCFVDREGKGSAQRQAYSSKSTFIVLDI